MKKERATKPDEGRTRKRIFVVEDHPIVREGLALLVNREPDLVICGEAADANEALQGIRTTHPNLVLMDISIRGSNGIELTKNVLKGHPGLRVIMLSMHDEALYAERALKAGARGYVMKHEAPEVVLKAIRRVLSGEVYVSENMSSRVVADLAGGSQPNSNRLGVERLTDRELEIFDLIGQGNTTVEMSRRLGISPKTVEAHRSHIKLKLGITKFSELALKAIRWVDSNGGQ